MFDHETISGEFVGALEIFSHSEILFTTDLPVLSNVLKSRESKIWIKLPERTCAYPKLNYTLTRERRIFTVIDARFPL